jgi:hypothetical protein
MGRIDLCSEGHSRCSTTTGGRTMKRKSDTYIAIYKEYRKERELELIDLRAEVRELKRMIEFLCKKVFE